MRDTLKVTFVGHIDHGKSTLIGRLLYDTDSVPSDRMEQIRIASEEQGRDTELAYLIDHLKEERDQGITIDTAQIFFGTEQRDYTVIDAPGHREFLKNMLTGASQAEASILLLDALEGIGEQTRRHAFLLHLLGVTQCVVAVNKMDLVNFAEERLRELSDSLEEHLRTVGLDRVACVPISAKEGDNVVVPSDRMPWYDGPTVLDALEDLEAMQEACLPTRFCVQDVYNFDGRRIAAGRVESGTLDAGDRVAILPENTETEILSIERFNSDKTLAEPGECIGVTLPDDIAPRRGQVLCDPASPPSIANTVTARLFWTVGQPLAKGEALPLKVGTQEAECVVRAIRNRIDSSSLEVLEEEAERLENTEVGEVELAASVPIVAELAEVNPSLGRLVLERGGGVAGAGIIIGIE